MSNTNITIPKKLAIYYGYPSLVNGANGNITSAISTFNVYDLVVFGDGLQIATHPDQAKTIRIIAGLPGKVFGHVRCTQTISAIKSDINKWVAMGVAGIFCQQFGFDFGVTRSTQNTIINYIHNKGVIAFVHTPNPDDTFSSAVVATYNPTGIAPVINSTDWYLDGSYQIIDGAYRSASEWTAKSNKLVTYKQSFGTGIACITTTNTSTFSQSQADYSYYSCVLYNFDAWGWGEPNYSTTSNSLPFRPRTPFIGTIFTGPITSNNGVYQRQTNVGINVNTNNDTTSILLS